MNVPERDLAPLLRPGSGGVDRLRRYLQRVRPAFDAAQESAARLAGLLITAEMRQSRHVLDWGSRTAGLQCLADAQASLSEAAVPERAAHFHHHLSQAVALLEGAWRATEDRRAGLVAAGDPLPQLQAAWEEIKFSSRAMPGFETVDFRNSCCAMHRKKSEPADKGEEDVGLFDLDT